MAFSRDELQFSSLYATRFAGRFSDERGRALFVFLGGTAYECIAFAFPFAPMFDDLLGFSLPMTGEITGAVVLVFLLNGLLGVADAFREPSSMALFADEGKGARVSRAVSACARSSGSPGASSPRCWAGG